MLGKDYKYPKLIITRRYIMKHNFFKIVAVLVFTLLAVSTSVAQSTGIDHATVTANIIAPIGITKTVDMNFGNVVATTTLGTVQLSVANGRIFTGGLTSPATDGTPTAAVFSITADADYLYTITIPSANHQISNGENHMQVNTWVTDQVTALNAEHGNVTLTIGATLNVGAHQVPGLYTSDAPFAVTVGYN
jgi:hypothetical protein